MNHTAEGASDIESVNCAPVQVTFSITRSDDDHGWHVWSTAPHVTKRHSHDVEFCRRWTIDADDESAQKRAVLRILERQLPRLIDRLFEGRDVIIGGIGR